VAHALGRARVPRKTDASVDPLLRRLGADEMFTRLGSYAGHRTLRRDHGARHRHRLENLILDAARDLQWRNSNRRMREIRRSRFDTAGNYYAFPAGKLLHFGSWPRPHYQESGIRQYLANAGKNLAGKPADGFDIR